MLEIHGTTIRITRGDTGLITIRNIGRQLTESDRVLLTIARRTGGVIYKAVAIPDGDRVQYPLYNQQTRKWREGEYEWDVRVVLNAVVEGGEIVDGQEVATPIRPGRFIVSDTVGRIEFEGEADDELTPCEQEILVSVESFKGPAGATGAQGEKGDKGDKGDPGEPGEPGRDGVSPTLTVEDIEGGHMVTITDVNGTRSFIVLNGKDGESGGGGVSEEEILAAVEAALEAAKESGEFDGPQGPAGPQGPQGETGPQGPTGATGKTGPAGADGTSVTVKSVSTSSADGGNNVVTFTDGKTLTVKNGSKGSPGDQGPQGETGPAGANGYSPVRGTDYWTAADIAEIKAYVDDAILGGAW